MGIDAFRICVFHGWPREVGSMLLELFRIFNGAETLIVAETRDLSPEAEVRLKKLYPNLELRNRPLDMSAMAAMAQTTIDSAKMEGRSRTSGYQ